MPMGTIRLRSTGVAGASFKCSKSEGHVFTPAPVTSGSSWAPPELNALAKIYSQFAFRSLRLRYEPLVGTTTSGGVTIAVTADSNGSGTLTETVVLSTSPNVTGPVWSEKSLVVPVQYLNQKKWFPICKDQATLDAQMGYQVLIMYWLNVANTSDDVTYGRLWLEYEVEFSGFGIQS